MFGRIQQEKYGVYVIGLLITYAVKKRPMQTSIMPPKRTYTQHLKNGIKYPGISSRARTENVHDGRKYQ